jgi:Fe-Mn family superoxide dismutase
MVELVFADKTRSIPMPHEKTYELPKLTYGYADLEPVYAREMLELHHSKHHAAYVAGANEALEKLAEMRGAKKYDIVNQLEKDFAFNLSGHVLHSIFWQCMSPGGGGEPTGQLAAMVDDAFGSLDDCRQHLSQAAVQIQGSGWAALSWDPVSGRLVTEQIHDHQRNIGCGTLPLLVLDMWEHAYYLQYKNEKKKWAKAFWDIVDWAQVSRRFATLRQADLGLAA